MTKEELKKLVDNLVITDVSVADTIMNDENLSKLTLEDLKIKGIITLIKGVDEVLEDNTTTDPEDNTTTDPEGEDNTTMGDVSGEGVTDTEEVPETDDEIVVDEGEEPETKSTGSKKSTK